MINNHPKEIYSLEIEKEHRLMENYISPTMGVIQFNILLKTDYGKEGTKENAERIVKCWNEYDKLKEERDRYEKSIVSLTPSGSEFVNDPEYCAKHVKDYQASQHKLICDLVIEKKKNISERDLLIEALKNILSEFEDKSVQMKTPIAYFRHFNKAEELLNNIKK